MLWSKLVVTGHSQGGGHAYVVAKLHEVARVITLGSPKDYSLYFHRPPVGFDSNMKTPLGRYFAFNHMQDSIAGCTHQNQMETLEQIGVTKYGICDADKTPGNYNRAHLLFTNIPYDASKEYAAHASVLGMAKTLSASDSQILSAAWKYLFTEPVQEGNR